MATDIVPIELGLPQGDLVTLWAPRWREDGEEWEAFLGDEDDLFAFPDSAHLAAFVRTAEQHDLIDHPAWNAVPALHVPELIPDDEHSYDLVGVPELVAEEPDSWTIGELAGVVSMVRSLADVCELDEVHEVLDAHEAFTLLEQGNLPITGRGGMRLWNDLARAVADKWDTVLDAIDQVVTVPAVDEATLDATAEELAAFHEESAETGAGVSTDRSLQADTDSDEDGTDFWTEVGIDPIKITTSTGEYVTLRCYIDDEPIFLGSDGRITVFRSERMLARQLANPNELGDNDLADVATWEEVIAKATTGDLDVRVSEDNTYVLAGIDDDIADGIDYVDPVQLDLAVELLTDAADWSGDTTASEVLAPSERLGWLVSFIVNPDPTRLAPSPPFDDEVAAWRKLVNSFEDRLHPA
ncbi:primosomal protein [Haloechinothrix sp. LS1_15]|uniref:primosomal protein n=1 Tax=Haloechinothrix sp. LS1_15 TaxID=2652248 RepID=UPI0029448059|nr:primosomal protein [Haloechinothrix sp. LS1_15]MDV6012980.1 primosomal protein [Haloechinothrix sp. LS1_15]